MTSALLATPDASAGEVVRTRTTVSQAHSYQWLGSFGNRGNGRYREELRKAIAAIRRYLAAYQLLPERTLLRLDGQYGLSSVLSDLASFAFVTRGKEYSVLDHPLIQARLHLPPDQFQQRPESQVERSLYDCPNVPVGSLGMLYRVVVATHPAGKKKSPVGVTHAGIVYELFFTNLPQRAFTVTIGAETLTVTRGHVVKAPPETSHKFTNTGTAPLRILSIHPSKEVIQIWLEA